MTRQKKEIIKKINELEEEIEIDNQLSFGIVPLGAHDSMYEAIRSLEEELARLRHYDCVEDMYYDMRGNPQFQDLPYY